MNYRHVARNIEKIVHNTLKQQGKPLNDFLSDMKSSGQKFEESNRTIKKKMDFFFGSYSNKKSDRNSSLPPIVTSTTVNNQNQSRSSMSASSSKLNSI